MSSIAESIVEEAALGWLESLGYTVKQGLEIAPGEVGAERTDYGKVVLERRLRDVLARLNPELPPEALDDAFRKITRARGWASPRSRRSRRNSSRRCGRT